MTVGGECLWQGRAVVVAVVLWSCREAAAGIFVRCYWCLFGWFLKDWFRVKNHMQDMGRYICIWREREGKERKEKKVSIFLYGNLD